MIKKILPIIVVLILVAGAFYSGMKYGQSKTIVDYSRADFQSLRNLSPEERQQRMQQMGAAGIGFQGNRSDNQAGSGFLSGEIIAKDDKSVTIKLRDGGSKIVFYSETTEVTKFVNGTAADLEIGKTITANGKTNQDGSITVQSIQLRPAITPVPAP